MGQIPPKDPPQQRPSMPMPKEPPLHGGEMVLPEHLADAVRVHFHAVDPDSLRQWFKANPARVSSPLAQRIHPSHREWLAFRLGFMLGVLVAVTVLYVSH